MKCETVKLPGGVTAIVCSRGSRSSKPTICQFCQERPATKLCDQIINSEGKKRTCDAGICDKCAASGGQGIDYCPNHAKHHALQGSLL